jgi:hypothetical protein
LIVAGLIPGKPARTASVTPNSSPDAGKSICSRIAGAGLAARIPVIIPDRFERRYVLRRVNRPARPLFALFGYPRLQRYPLSANTDGTAILLLTASCLGDNGKQKVFPCLKLESPEKCPQCVIEFVPPAEIPAGFYKVFIAQYHQAVNRKRQQVQHAIDLAGAVSPGEKLCSRWYPQFFSTLLFSFSIFQRARPHSVAPHVDAVPYRFRPFCPFLADADVKAYERFSQAGDSLSQIRRLPLAVLLLFFIPRLDVFSPASLFRIISGVGGSTASPSERTIAAVVMLRQQAVFPFFVRCKQCPHRTFSEE